MAAGARSRSAASVCAWRGRGQAGAPPGRACAARRGFVLGSCSWKGRGAKRPCSMERPRSLPPWASPSGSGKQSLMEWPCSTEQPRSLPPWASPSGSGACAAGAWLVSRADGEAAVTQNPEPSPVLLLSLVRKPHGASTRPRSRPDCAARASSLPCQGRLQRALTGRCPGLAPHPAAPRSQLPQALLSPGYEAITVYGCLLLPLIPPGVRREGSDV